jgi:hypothetical protein
MIASFEEKLSEIADEASLPGDEARAIYPYAMGLIEAYATSDALIPTERVKRVRAVIEALRRVRGL